MKNLIQYLENDLECVCKNLRDSIQNAIPFVVLEFQCLEVEQ